MDPPAPGSFGQPVRNASALNEPLYVREPETNRPTDFNGGNGAIVPQSNSRSPGNGEDFRQVLEGKKSVCHVKSFSVCRRALLRRDLPKL